LRRRRGIGAALRAAAVFGILGVGLVGACQPSTPSPSASSVATASTSDVPSSSPDGGAPPSGGAITVDPSLLAILPAEVGGAPMLPAPETATDIALDQTLAADVEAIAVGLAVSPGASASSGAEDLVIANVVRLRPDVFDESFFRDWRETYDAAACEPAGGVRGNAESEIDGRQVFIGSCANGGLTYHVRYGEDVIVSLTSLGEGRFGELVVKNLGK
jgi:hypothetical protein